MTLKENNKLLILKYKFLFEENNKIKSELSIGSADFLSHLSFFRKKLTKAIDCNNQVKKFDNIFFNKEKNTNCSLVKENTVLRKTLDAKKEYSPKWFKKLYKKIVSVTHPDKTSIIHSKVFADKLTNQYMIATVAYEKMEYEKLIIIVYQI